jgi:hypothetical protein
MMILDTKGQHLLNRGNLRDVIIVLAIAFSLAGPEPELISYLVPLGVLTAGCFLHFIVKGQLIRNVVMCTEGTYAIVRHPYYLANFLIDCAFCLLSLNLYLIFAYPFLFFWAYGPHIRQEEQRLAHSHPEQFYTYCTAVPQIFPDSNSIRNLKNLLKNTSSSRITSNEVKRISRFFAVTGFIILCQEIKTDGWEELTLWHTPVDYDFLLIVLLSVLLFLYSLMGRRGKKILKLHEE